MASINTSYQNISKDAIRVWRLTNIIESVISIVILSALIGASYYFNWYTWIGVTFCVLLALVVLNSVWEIGFQPIYLQKSWRFSISEEFVRIHKGIWVKKETVIPMTKVQFVELKQGPLFRRHDLNTISIQTIRSAHAIPAIKSWDAGQLRDEIAAYAKVEEED
ncbi:PH domain-containing protein [Virgibacillus halophilus]|uniref:PH domain-containing protein n=1 Tax=Tigheibacillus halophilus TaxID=361280 RepID=UPI003625ED46